MIFHIPIPDARVLTLTIITLWSLGCSNIATHVYHRWVINRKVHPMLVQIIVKCIICFAAIKFIKTEEFITSSWLTMSLGIFFGLVGGLFVVDMELLINRLFRFKHKYSTPEANPLVYSKTKGKIATLSPDYARSRVNLKNLHDTYAAGEAKILYCPFWMIIVVAILEEYIFRGILVSISLILPSPYCYLALIATVIIFGCSHASFGIHQMFSKFILGGVCLLGVLIFHMVLPAIIIHVILNWNAYIKQQEFFLIQNKGVK